ncbi:CBD9-like protein, partial [Ophiobolus disseminans]
VSAQVASVCPSTNVCFKLNIPASTASSGSGDVFFQISAPSTYEWVALGQGKGMANSNMFLVYTNSGGTNVTLSPRTASGHSTPSLNSAAKVTLLEGSGVSNGLMTANVKCSNCNSWSGGDMDFKSSSGNWIYAYQSSSGPKNSNDQSASIKQHNKHDAFSWDFASAKGGSSVNPLVAAAPAASGGGGGGGAATSCIRRNAASATGSGAGSATSGATSPTPSSNSENGDDNTAARESARSRYASNFASFPTARPSTRPPSKRQNLPYCDELPNSNGNNGNTNTGFTPISASGSGGNQRTMLIAHGVLASLAFVIFFPAGAIAIRLASFPGMIWIHAAFQVFAYIVYIIGVGLGVYLAKDMNLTDNYHPVIGIVVLIAIFFQPILGWLHHSLFKKYQHRTLWSYAHIWLGRVAITVGIINGGLGLRLADSMNMSSKGGMIAYGVIAGFMWLAWVAASWIGERRRMIANRNAPPKYTKSPRQGSDNSELIEVPPAVGGHYAPPKQR